MALDIVIMAAGKGTRMKSALPKVLHRLAGTSLLQHVLATATALEPDAIVVVTGHGAEAVEALVDSVPRARSVRQAPQLGTGHAVLQAVPYLHAAGTTLVLNGDVPLIEPASLRALIDAAAGGRLALLTCVATDSTGYGRIVRAGAPAGPSDGAPGAVADTAPVLAIVEQKDASAAQRLLREVYTGAMAAPTALLKDWLARLTDANVQREYYLTDVVKMAVADGVAVVARPVGSEVEMLGVNSPAQLADLERRVQRRRAERLMDAGVRLADPARFDLRGTLDCGADVEIDINAVFEGRVTLGAGARVGANCVIRDATIGAGAEIHPFTHIDGAVVGVGARVGPYARLRPGTVLAEEVHVGNFVEVKNTTLGRGAKANHLAYLGDATVGERVNFGAGSITANYDGANKHRTTIEADAHVGSNCVLVAPMTVGAGATIGGGSTIAKDAPAGHLTVARARQTSYPNWKRAAKKAG